MEHCKQEHRLNEVEKDIRELQKCAIELKEGHAETRIYVKQIFERIDDLKAMFKVSTEYFNSSKTEKSNAMWTKLLMEAIKMIGIVGAIVAGIKIIDRL